MYSWIKKCALAALAACGVSLLASTPAAAQYPYPIYPAAGGGYYDAWGNYHWVSPQRADPWTNVAQPGTLYRQPFFVPYRGWGYRDQWIDVYGAPRSNTVIPGPYGTSSRVYVSQRIRTR